MLAGFVLAAERVDEPHAAIVSVQMMAARTASAADPRHFVAVPCTAFLSPGDSFSTSYTVASLAARVGLDD